MSDRLHALWRNPLFMMGVRTRLRPRQAMVAGLVVGTITTFLVLLVFLTTSERAIFGQRDAARATFVPLLVIQGFVLMFLGTGAVASGVASERESGLFDYHRMTPMRPSAKIVGYLFGLPVREYFMFSLTVPFVIVMAAIGQVSALRLMQLYVVFFSAVLLYHMTGFVAGMVSQHPRRAAWFARMLVVALYLVLPQLAEAGISTFAYLTIAPTFQGLVRAELGLDSAGEALAVARWQRAPFYGLELDPMLFSLLLQGFLLATLFVIVHRKWRQSTQHALSKVQVVVFYAVLQWLVVGSLWPILSLDRASVELMIGAGLTPPDLFRAVMYLFLSLSTGFALWLVHVSTADRFVQLQGRRRAHKRGQQHPDITEDSASNLWVCVALIGITVVSYAVVIAQARGHGLFGAHAPGLLAISAPMVLFASLLIYAQALRETRGTRGLLLFAFVTWVAPTLVALILLAAWDALLPAAWLATPSPVSALLYASLALVRDGREPLEASGHLVPLLATSIVFSMVAAAWGLRAMRRNRALDA